MKIYDGESEMARDVWSMVVITDQSPYMKIYGGEITNMPIDENLWWWKLIEAYRWKSMVVKTD